MATLAMKSLVGATKWVFGVVVSSESGTGAGALVPADDGAAAI